MCLAGSFFEAVLSQPRKDPRMNDLSSSTGRIERLRAIARQVRDFAEKEAESSGLPGQDQGPADAYRHLVGVADRPHQHRDQHAVLHLFAQPAEFNLAGAEARVICLRQVSCAAA